MLEANFWQDKSRSKKILKEKKLFEDLTNTYKNSEKNLADFKELYKLAIDEQDISKFLIGSVTKPVFRKFV